MPRRVQRSYDTPRDIVLCKLWMGAILLLSAAAMGQDRMTDGLFGWYLITMLMGPFAWAQKEHRAG